MFHLWLVPTGDVGNRLADVISELSTRYHGPKFDPHLTLLGKLEGDEESLVELTRQLARSLHPLEVRLREPGYASQYFRCLFLPVEPCPPIRRVHQQAERIFGRQSTSSFDPHISLLYGLFPARVKQGIIKILPTDLPNALRVSRLQLIRVGSTNPKDWRTAAMQDI